MRRQAGNWGMGAGDSDLLGPQISILEYTNIMYFTYCIVVVPVIYVAWTTKNSNMTQIPEFES